MGTTKRAKGEAVTRNAKPRRATKRAAPKRRRADTGFPPAPYTRAHLVQFEAVARILDDLERRTAAPALWTPYEAIEVLDLFIETGRILERIDAETGRVASRRYREQRGESWRKAEDEFEADARTLQHRILSRLARRS